MADLSILAKAAKRVGMDDLYVAIDALKDQQSADFRHLSERIDNLGSQVNQRIDSLGTQVNQRIDQLNQRLDTVIQMLMELSKQISSQKNQ